jgi:hypothetical protein
MGNILYAVAVVLVIIWAIGFMIQFRWYHSHFTCDSNYSSFIKANQRQ